MTKPFRITANWAGILLFILLSLPAACVSPTAPLPSNLDGPVPAASLLSRLYFGRSIPGGGQVTERQWTAFLADVVTPRFPSGFTTWSAQGQWREKSGTIVQEPVFIVEIVHGADVHAVDAIKAIVAEYKRRFRQEAVLWIRDRVETDF